MRMKPLNWWKVSTLGLAACVGVLLAADNSKSEALPPAVTAALKRLFPDCEIKRADDDTDHGEKIFEVRLMDAAGKQNILAEVTAAGEVLELDEDLPMESVPHNVQKALRKAFPHAKVEHVEKGTKMDISYRFDISENGKKHEVKLNRKGRIFEVEPRN